MPREVPMRISRYLVRCGFCNSQDWIARPLHTGQTFYCSVECVTAAESDLANRVRALTEQSG